PGTHFIFSNLLEQLASDKDKGQGKDIADYLIKHDWRLFRNTTKQKEEEFWETIKKDTPIPKVHVEVLPKNEISKPEFSNPIKKGQTESWEQEITDLENYFAVIELPTQPIRLNPCSTITNVSLFIKSHFATVK